MQLLDAEELVLACQSSPPVPAGLCNRWALRSSYLPACRGPAWQFPYPDTAVRFHAPRIPRARFALGRLLPFRLPVAQANGCADDVRFWSDSVTLPLCPGLSQSNARAHAHALPRILPLVLHHPRVLAEYRTAIPGARASPRSLCLASPRGPLPWCLPDFALLSYAPAAACQFQPQDAGPSAVQGTSIGASCLSHRPLTVPISGRPRELT